MKLKEYDERNFAGKKKNAKKTMLDKYEVIKKLGEGAFGTVYLCEVINSEYKVAVKVIDIKDAGKNNVSIKDIETEIEVLKELDSP